tara:strand:+ start:613 stop:867 length:255 start_codon:yes stop_codon:yes gene_type:complete
MNTKLKFTLETLLFIIEVTVGYFTYTFHGWVGVLIVLVAITSMNILRRFLNKEDDRKKKELADTLAIIKNLKDLEALKKQSVEG